MKWVIIDKNDSKTFPTECEDVLVSDGIDYDVALYIVGTRSDWYKMDVPENLIFPFKSFEVLMWASITKSNSLKL
jgi:hypothetical protein